MADRPGNFQPGEEEVERNMIAFFRYLKGSHADEGRDNKVLSSWQQRTGLAIKALNYGWKGPAGY